MGIILDEALSPIKGWDGLDVSMNQNKSSLIAVSPGFVIYFISCIVNDMENFVFGSAKASVYGFGRSRKQKFVMSFTIMS